MKPYRKTNQITNIINSTLIDLPSPSNISYWWNMGSLLGICLLTQILTGLMLTIHYAPDTETSFSTISHIMRDVNAGWLMRTIHANGASLFFFLIYIHIARGMYFSSYLNKKVWLTGIMIILILMGTAFMGYVLPWGQMSFWAATVITNLLSAIPYMGKITVQWIWGGFSVSNPTLTRFFTFHFILPFLILILMMTHILFLHEKGSSNPMGLPNNTDKSPFHPFFSWKDLMGLMITMTIFTHLTLNNPFLLSDPENFIPANPLVTPVHIQPEWYFLYAYAILRSIPNKLGGVIALITSILILTTLPLTHHKHKTLKMKTHHKITIWMFFSIFMILTWLGAQPVEPPYENISQIMTILYFTFFLTFPLNK
uniref:Cytochrome b n=1 Tax=Pseudocellus gertschi TaxID=1329481 RepID=W5R4N9_9ARAC|nr:cytochrome b [Pseudocellus gertschi]AGL11942.1 cytochrome b [Pseudocellus gertschi]